jgi:ankyrin repeat protein
VAGPVIVPVSSERGSDTHRIFLAVAKGPAEGLSGYISDCVLYEFNDRGKPVSMVKLPYMISGPQRAVRKDSVVWKCQDDALVCTSATEHTYRGGGPGGPDLLTRISWLRRITSSQPDAWLAADPASDAVAFGRTHAFCLPSGGYISKPHDHVYHFPLSAIGLDDGAEQACTLHVPFAGEAPVPGTNYSMRGTGEEAKIHTHGPYLLGITQLRLVDGILEITLGSAAVRFDLHELDFLRPQAASRQDDQAIAAWVRALGDVNKRDKEGNTPLYNVSGDVDSRRVKALLKAGADVKAKMKTGWTPLMSAACSGTAEVVQLLIDAGSDVNARDGNCGGQTVLIWAARGSREQKKKVQALLKANADPKATSENGWNALIWAAHAGELPCVELFVEQGVDVNADTKDGTTALMAGAGQSDNSSIVPVLLKAGADVHARDKKCRTPLMHAAMQGSPENIRALIAAGADLDVKDDSGKTALDLTRNSNYFGAWIRTRVLEAAKAQKKGRK